MPSAVIHSFNYDAEKQELTVIFQSGRAYVYLEVPADVHQGMTAAFSKGEYFNDRVRDRFAFRRQQQSG